MIILVECDSTRFVPPSESMHVGRVITMLSLRQEGECKQLRLLFISTINDYSGDIADIGGVASDDIGRRPHSESVD